MLMNKTPEKIFVLRKDDIVKNIIADALQLSRKEEIVVTEALTDCDLHEKCFL